MGEGVSLVTGYSLSRMEIRAGAQSRNPEGELKQRPQNTVTGLLGLLSYITQVYLPVIS